MQLLRLWSPRDSFFAVEVISPCINWETALEQRRRRRRGGGGGGEEEEDLYVITSVTRYICCKYSKPVTNPNKPYYIHFVK